MRTVLLMSLLSALLVSGQIALKQAITSLGGSVSIAKLVAMLMQPALWISILCIALGTAVWAYVLSYESLSRVYPMVSLSYVFMALVMHFAFGEPFSLNQAIGTALIVLGVIVLFR